MVGPGEKFSKLRFSYDWGGGILMLVFSNTVNTSFSYMLFHLLYKHYVAFNFQNFPGFDNIVTQFYLNFLKFQKLGDVTLPPYTLGRYFVCGSNCWRRWYGKAAREERKNGVALALRRLFKLICLVDV